MTASEMALGLGPQTVYMPIVKSQVDRFRIVIGEMDGCEILGKGNSNR